MFDVRDELGEIFFLIALPVNDIIHYMSIPNSFVFTGRET